MKFALSLFVLALTITVIRTTIFNQGIGISPLGEEKSVEALQWLNNNANPYAFAGNRFDETKDAIAFVEKLYKAGAEEVRVSGIYDEPERIKEEGGAYADTLIVKLPKDKNQRTEIFKIYNDELKNEFGEEENYEDQGERTLVFWWD